MKAFLFILLLLGIVVPLNSQTDDKLLLLHNPFEQNYYVEIKVIKGNVTTTPIDFRREDIIHYTVNVELLTVCPDYVIAKINRKSDVYVNHKPSSLTVANELAVRVSSALYPIVLQFDKKGKITDVVNFDEVNERWEDVKKDLLKDFYGEGFDIYVNKNNNNFKNKVSLISGLTNDCVMSLLFNNLVYTQYSDKGTAVNQLNYPYIFNAKPLTNLVNLKKSINKDGTVYVRFDGSYADDRGKYDLLNELDYPSRGSAAKPVAGIEGAYFLNPEYNHLKSILFYYGMELTIEKSMIIRINHFEVYANPIQYPAKTQNCIGQIYVPLQIYSDVEKDVQRHINPLVDIKDSKRRE